MRHCRAAADGNGALVNRFGAGDVIGLDVKSRQTQIRFDSLRIQLDRAIQLRERFLFLFLREQDRAQQNVPFDVVRVFLEDFFGKSFGFAKCCGGLLRADKIVVAELHAHVEIVRIELRRLAHLVERLLISLQPLISRRQSPVRISELLVDLQRGAKLEHGFLKLFVYQQCLPTGDVLSFGFFGGRARAQDERGNQHNGQGKNVKLAAALSIFHYSSVSPDTSEPGSVRSTVIFPERAKLVERPFERVRYSVKNRLSPRPANQSKEKVNGKVLSGILFVGSARLSVGQGPIHEVCCGAGREIKTAGRRKRRL